MAMHDTNLDEYRLLLSYTQHCLLYSLKREVNKSVGRYGPYECCLHRGIALLRYVWVSEDDKTLIIQALAEVLPHKHVHYYDQGSNPHTGVVSHY